LFLIMRRYILSGKILSCKPVWSVNSFLIAILILTSVLLRAQTGPLKVGVAAVDITPPIGYPEYFGISTGILDPLYAKALVFKQGNTQGALLICNLLGVPRDLSRRVRDQASRETGIPFQNISVTATHSHTGPAFQEDMQQYANRDADGKLTAEDQKGYIASLIRGMKDAIVTANKEVKEVAMKTGIGSAPGISFNRRYLMKDGRVTFNPGGGNKSVVRPAGPIDPAVPFVMFRPINGTTYSASLSVFASHYARGGTDFSSDYPHYLEENLRKTFGNQFISVWGSGTCGDINTIDVMSSLKGPINPPAKMVEIAGNTLADAIRKALPQNEQKNPKLAILSRTIYLPLQGYTEAQLKWAKNDTLNLLYAGHREQDVRRRAKILGLERLRQYEAIPPSVSGEPWTLPLEIQIFRLDDQNAIVTLPGEVFVELGMDLKKRSPFSNTIIIELANVGISYVPTLRGFSEESYEAINSRMAPSSGEKMVEEALKMLKSLK
jgi:neutral ceramidase